MICGSALFFISIPAPFFLFFSLQYSNLFYNSEQSCLEQEVSVPDNGLQRLFLPPLVLLFYTSPLWPHNSALLASEGGNQGEKAPALWNTLRERGLLFLHSGWPFGSPSPLLPPRLDRRSSLSPSSGRGVAWQRWAGAVGAGAERFRVQIGG